MEKRMKRVISFVCAVAMFCSLFVTVQAAGTIVTVDTKSIQQGTGTESVEIPITIADNSGLAGFQIEVKYSDGLILESITKGEALSLLTFTKPKDLTANPVTLPWDGESDVDTSNGVIAVLTFSVPKENVKEYAIDATLKRAYDGDLLPVDVAIVNGTITITEKPKENMTDLTFTDATYDYDGTAKALEVAGNLPQDAEVVYTSADFDADGKAINAGTYNIKATVTAPGYNTWEKEAVLTINKKEVVVTGLTAADKTYDGTTDATLSGGTIPGIVVRDAADQYCEEHKCYRIKYYIPEVGTFADANAGTGKAVSLDKIVLDGCSANNYTLVQPTVTANITKAPLTITADNVSKKVGTEEPKLTHKLTGELFGYDTLEVTLQRAAGENVGEYAITAKKINVSDNYEVTFNPGVFTIVDKTPQNIKVDGIVTEKTYGEEGFKITVTPDEKTGCDDFTITSSNTDVAEIDASGNVTIKNAGTTTISVREPGNDEYAAFDKTWTLTVNKVAIEITAENKEKIIGQKDPELTYTYDETKLVGEDKIEGALARAEGEEVGKYDITIGTLKINDNYDITFNKGVFEIVPKTAQTIAVAPVDAKTYGDEGFKLDVTADKDSELNTFTYVSSDDKVATVDKEGSVTIVGAGKATITVTQEGNEIYAAATATAEITVNARTVGITSVNMSEKTAEYNGILDADLKAVELDFDKIKTTVLSSESKTEGETTTVTTKLKVTNLTLKGDKAANYAVATDAYVEAEVVTETIAEKLTEDENVTIEATKVDDKTVVVTDVEIAKNEEDNTPKSDTVVIDATKVENAIVNAIAILKEIVEKIVEEVAEKAGLEITVNAGREDEGQKATITLDTKALEAITEESSTVLTISVEKPKKEELPEKQAEVLEEVKDNAPVVYSIGIVDNDGNEVVAKENGGFGEGKAKVKFPYKKPDGKGKVKVKHVKDDGTTEEIKDAKYENEFVEVDLKHFSEYLIYTEAEADTPVKPSTGGGLAAGGDKSNAGADKLGDEDKTEAPEQTPVVTPSTPAGFADLGNYAWAADAITNLVEKGIIKGTSATTYSPANNIIRADFVALVVRMFNLTSENSENFADVNASDYFARELAIARNSGIVGGIGDNKFAPRGNITRQDMMVMLYRAMQKLDIQLTGTQTQNVSDLDTVSEYAKEAVETLMANGIINGKNGKIDPMASATRAEVAVMLNRVLDLVK